MLGARTPDGSLKPMRRARRLAVGVLTMVCIGTAAGCSRYTPSYDRDGNVNGDLISEMHTFAGNLSSGRGAEIIGAETVPGFMAVMGRFLKGHVGRPTRVVHIGAAGDQLAAEYLAITCRPHDVQHAVILWRWQDGDWRGWPGAVERANGTYVKLRPCD